MQWILLPGLDGTGRLFEQLLDVIPRTVQVMPISFPTDQVLGYRELHDYVRQKLPDANPYILIAESFSGPLAVQLASTGLYNLKALVLCATYLCRPITQIKSAMARVANRFVFEFQPPEWPIKHYLLGPDAPKELVQQFNSVISLVKPKVLSERVRIALEVNVREEFSRVSIPVLWISATLDNLIDWRRSERQVADKSNVCVKRVASPHLVLQRRSAEVVQCMNEFIKNLLLNQTGKA